MKRRVRSPELTEGNPKRTQLYRHFDCNGVLLYVATHPPSLAVRNLAVALDLLVYIFPASWARLA
jgi:hypothetical protein